MKRSGYVFLVILLAVATGWLLTQIDEGDESESFEVNSDGIQYMDIKELEEKTLSKDWDALDIVDTAAQPELALPTLTELIKNDDPEVREIALNCVSLIQDPQVPKVLADALGDEDSDVRLFALQALQTEYDESILGELTANLDNEDGEIRAGVALLLGLLNQPASMEPLQKRLDIEQDESVQRDIKLALAKLGDEDMKDEFAAQLDVADSPTRLQGLEDLRYIGDKNLAVRILPALDDFGEGHLISDMNEEIPRFARVCDAGIELVAELYEKNPFPFEVVEFKIYSDEEVEQAKAFLTSLKVE